MQKQDLVAVNSNDKSHRSKQDDVVDYFDRLSQKNMKGKPVNGFQRTESGMFNSQKGTFVYMHEGD